MQQAKIPLSDQRRIILKGSSIRRIGSDRCKTNNRVTPYYETLARWPPGLVETIEGATGSFLQFLMAESQFRYRFKRQTRTTYPRNLWKRFQFYWLTTISWCGKGCARC